MTRWAARSLSHERDREFGRVDYRHVATHVTVVIALESISKTSHTVGVNLFGVVVRVGVLVKQVLGLAPRTI